MTARSQKNIDREEMLSLFRIYRDSRDPAIKTRLVDMNMDLVRSLAHRFANRGEPFDDLVQVASIGLLKSIDRFDPDRNVKFATYAVPTIVGELKRYFRDRTGTIRLPRGLRERSYIINSVVRELSQEHGRSPGIAEIARASGLSEDEVIEVLASNESMAIASLDSTATEEGETSLLDVIGDEDRALTMLDERLSLAGAVSSLGAREKDLLYLRFIEGRSQTEIARNLGVSQMHVSRLLRRTLKSLRQNLAIPRELL